MSSDSSPSSLELTHGNRARLATLLKERTWVVACLCAAWCDVCREYRPSFDQLAQLHPDIQFLWIDIEDQADVVGDLDVENFPTLLIQRDNGVAFYGTVQPDARQANRLLQSLTEKTEDDLTAEASASAERSRWQRECNLRERLNAWVGE